MESGGMVRTEKRLDISGAGESTPPEVYLLFPRQVHQEESAADRQSDDSLFQVTLQNAVL
jgi:hypothetical protein